MKIYCKKCEIILGEIRDARLRKNVSYLCNVCTKKLITGKSNKSTRSTKKNTTGYNKFSKEDPVDFLRGIFNS